MRSLTPPVSRLGDPGTPVWTWGLVLSTVGVLQVLPADRDPGRPSACSIVEVSRTSLQIDGRDVYVEPVAMASSERGVLLLGTPNYVTERDSSGRLAALRENTMIGVTAGTGWKPEWRAVAPPPGMDPSYLGAFRVAPIEDGGWGILFVEFVEPYEISNVDNPIRHVWYAEYDGDRWGTPTSLPVSRAGGLDPFSGSRLVSTGSGIGWAVPFRGSGTLSEVDLFLRDGQGRWTLRTLETGGVGYPVLDRSRKHGLVLAVVKADRSEQSDHNSLFLYTDLLGLYPLEGRKILDGGERPVYRPRLLLSPGMEILTWKEMSGLGVGPVKAVLVDDLSEWDAEKSFLIDPSVIDYSVFALPDMGPIWITTHVTSDLPGKLRFSILRDRAPTTIGRMDNPYTTTSTAVPIGGDRFLLSGADVRWTSDRYALADGITSLLVEIRVDCPSEVPPRRSSRQ